MLWLLAVHAAWADANLNGDLKSFNLVSFPYEAPLLFPSTDPMAQAVVDGRLKGELTFNPERGPRWRLLAHHAVSVVSGSAVTLGGTGAAGTAPELVDLTWTVPEGGGATTVQGRTDRLLVESEAGPVTWTLGRQPVSFGTGLFFTPLDLVNPFFPGTIDTEYKPGVDALRVEAYGGLRFQQTLVAAWVGDCAVTTDGCLADSDDLALVSWSRVTLGVSDLGLFLGEVREDEVIGLSVVSALGPVGVHADASVTLPAGGGDPFVRAVLGADGRPGPKTSLSGELYVQSNGAADPADYLLQAMGPRYVHGELWALGRFYTALSLSQELRPTLTGSLALIANVEDPSALLLPSLSASLADEVDLSAGAYVGLGARPEGLDMHSEFGLLPVTAYLRLAAYF